jgi:phage-related protein
VSDGESWTLDDWRTPQGNHPVWAYLDGLSKGARAKAYAVLDQLTEHGNRLGMPLSRALGGGLFELRVTHPEGPFRLIYCFRSGRRIVVLYAFTKRTEQIPREDLELARKRAASLR